MTDTVVVALADARATEALGAALARAAPGPLQVHLEGDLGAGKTTLARGFLRALGHQGPVRSPTYTLLESYELPGARVHHLDLYRLADPGEVEYLGLRDLLAGGHLLVEWPGRGAGWLPQPQLRVQLSPSGGGRLARIEATDEAGRKVLAALRKGGLVPPGQG